MISHKESSQNSDKYFNGLLSHDILFGMFFGPTFSAGLNVTSAVEKNQFCLSNLYDHELDAQKVSQSLSFQHYCFHFRSHKCRSRQPKHLQSQNPTTADALVLL